MLQGSPLAVGTQEDGLGETKTSSFLKVHFLGCAVSGMVPCTLVAEIFPITVCHFLHISTPGLQYLVRLI